MNLKKKIRVYIQGIGLLVGMIFGAGIFALPYVIVKAGIWWGAAHFLVSFAVLLFLHLLYGEIAFAIKGKHRITGYVEALLGKKAKFIAFLFTLFSGYGSLLVYMILGGSFLSNIFSFKGETFWAVALFALGSFLIVFNIKRIGDINFYLTVPIFALVIFLIFIAAPDLNAENFSALKFFKTSHWFLPYGVFVFALSGFSAVPEVKEIFQKNSLADFKNVIKISMFVSAFLYLLFIVSVVGISGFNASEDSFSGLESHFGKKIIILGSALGFLAIITSFVALAADMKNIFYFDYKFSYETAWFFAVFPVLILFFVVSSDLVTILSAVGSIGLGVFGVFVLLMAEKIKKTTAYNGVLSKRELLFVSPIILRLAILTLAASAIYEALRIFI